MAISAVSAPVPIAGFIAVAAAEFIATWFGGAGDQSGCAAGAESDIGRAGRFLRFHVGGDCGYADRARSVTSRPDAMLRACAVVEFLRRWCWMRVPVGGGEYSDAA